MPSNQFVQHVPTGFFCERLNKANLRQGRMYVLYTAILGFSELRQTSFWNLQNLVQHLSIVQHLPFT